MIKARNERTSRYLETLRRQDQRDRDLRRIAKKNRVPMRLARVQFHCDGSVTRTWRND